MLEDKINSLISDFSNGNLIAYLEEKNKNFTFYKEDKNLLSYQSETFSEIYKIADIKLEDETNFAVFTIRTTKELTERSSKKNQFELGKKILKNEGFDAGFFVFYDENKNFRFSLIHSIYKGTRREFSHYKRYTYYVEKDAPYRTFKESLFKLQLTNLEGVKDAFSVEKVTDEFFSAYKYALYEIIMKNIWGNNITYQQKHSFAQQLLSRIMFIYFIQKKGWLKWKGYVQDKAYIKNLWLKYKEQKTSNDSFYSVWLSSLFFGAFNKKSQLIHKNLPEEIQESFRIMPYLNGGLFSKTDLDELGFDVPDWIFEWLFEPDEKGSDKRKGFLEIFNFTTDESQPLDVEVAVDPEMLGKVYESLISEEERGKAGIFYTPRVEIDFMCRISLTEYLASETKINKEKIIDFIFDPHNKILQFSEEELKEIREKLDKVKIVDPAVGSASFLVGMMNILVELHSVLTEKIEKREENLFALKQRIIQENLYGVDVKDWACMVGELRLWLSLIIETEEKYMDIYTKPLLPNLNFKIRQGDSLVEEIGGVQLSLRRETPRYLPKSIETKIKELIDKKNAFFSGQRSADLREIEEIEKLEHDIFTEILESKIEDFSKKIENLEKNKTDLEGQKDVFDKEDEKAKQEIKNIESEIEELIKEKEKYKSGLANLKQKAKKDYFLWEVDFAEVFAERGGFDIVIGNPPYVRQEMIAPPLENKNNYTDEEWRKLKSEYKEKLINSVKNIWPYVKKIDKKSDLYVYFYYHGLSLLKPKGIFCFINSNSWLDVGYGAGLQEFLLKNMKPIYIIDNLKKRSFKESDVNTVIVLIQRPEKKLDDYTIKFVAFKKPFEDVINAEVIKRIEKANKPIFDDEDFRIFPKTKRELLLEGVEEPEEEGLIKDPELLLYIGNKWGGKYLRAPEIYFKILEKGKGKLVKLGDIAEVRRGFTTGANEFFYLEPIGMTVKEVVEIAEKNPDTLIPVKNSAGWEGEIEAKFLKPVIKSSRELKTIIVRLEDLNHLVFMCHKSEKELRGTKALEYIKWGEKQKYHELETMRNRNPWFALNFKMTKILMLRASADRPAFYISEKSIFHDQTFYSVNLKNQEFEEILGMLFNNTFTNFLSREIESGASSSLGQGVKWSAVYESRRLLVLVPNTILKKDLPLIKRMPSSIFTELGFDPDKPIREQEPNPLPDRKVLDDIVFDALGLTEEERKEVYWSVAELVKNRLEKARSV
ncbi:MAG: BREX-1 system adenine-specific DNA-methyltransferase PglX [Candidatus Omnitrophica bacterium]|nr:BREX-1 system adenine-specific DNA-methyltransferase PglX [Candidatus Omnitrophota bacterium]